MPPRRLSPALVRLIADRFRVLGEPARLSILIALQPGERTVTDLTEATHLSQANVSKHLAILHAQGFVSRRKAGLFSWYAVADEGIYDLCDFMCGRLESEVREKRSLLDKTA